MAMWRRGAKLESAYFLREFGKWLCFPCRSYGNSVLHLHNSITKAELFLVGVCHTSPKSAEVVRQVIKDSKPNVVAVELCRERGRKLLSCKGQKSMIWDEFFAVKGGLKVKILNFMIHKLYARLAATSVKSGNEFRVAIKEGLALGANIVYMDQDMNVTLKRLAEEFSVMEMILYKLRKKEIYRQYPVLCEALNSGDPDAIIMPKAQEEAQGLGDKYFPGLFKSMLHERNEYMVKALRKMPGSIVGVVGALHVHGMHKLWQEAEVKDSSIT